MKFTSDTHFGSERVLVLSRRPYKSVEEMDKELIRNWNESVSNDEDVYHLGDFGNYDIVSKLNGKIHLILGNYEIKDIENGVITKKELLEKGFASVYDYLYIDNFVDELPDIDKIKLVHEPSKCDIYNDKILNLFGHIHGRQLCKKFGLDVGVDGHHMRVVDSKDISFFLTAIKKVYDDEVFL